MMNIPISRTILAAIGALFVFSYSAACLVDESSQQQPGADIHAENVDGTETTYDPLQGYTAPDLEERLRLLRQEHDFTDEGKTCSEDTACGAPLRCEIENKCAFPPALTGQVDDTTPYVLITTQQSDVPLRYFIETAEKQAEQMRGLMHRQLMSEQFGMLFIFQFESTRSFWMRNTFIPLDMVFIEEDGDIVSIVENAVPLTETSRRSAGPAKYVLELAGGETARAGIAAGDHVSIVVPEL